MTKKRFITHRKLSKKLYKPQQIEQWCHLWNASEVLLAQNFDGDSVKDGRKVQVKSTQKFVHKLNKQQTEWWRHLPNLAELFFLKDFYDVLE